MTRVYKIELLVVDHDELGPESVTRIIEEARYPNDCLGPNVMRLEQRVIAWADDHPLNRPETMRTAFDEMFGRR